MKNAFPKNSLVKDDRPDILRYGIVVDYTSYSIGVKWNLEKGISFIAPYRLILVTNPNEILAHHPDAEMSYTLSIIQPISHKPNKGMNCSKCGMKNDYAESNQSDGSYICYNCRS